MHSADSTLSPTAHLRDPRRARAGAARAALHDLLYLLAVVPLGAAAWLGTFALIRRAADLDRRLAGWYREAPIVARYRRPAGPGIRAQLRTASGDPQRRRDLRWVMFNSTAGLIMSTVAVTLSGLVIAYLTSPMWAWAISTPSGHYAVLNLGLYTVHSTALAFVNTALGLALAPAAIAVNRATASAHARLAARMLGPRG